MRRGLVLETPVPERGTVISMPWNAAITPEGALEALAQAEGAGSSTYTLATEVTSAYEEGKGCKYAMSPLKGRLRTWATVKSRSRVSRSRTISWVLNEKPSA